MRPKKEIREKDTVYITTIKMHSSCDIEDLFETHLCMLCDTLVQYMEDPQ